MTLVSLHLPKTAGSSLREVLERHFAAGLLPDYEDRPLNTPRPRREWRALREGWRLGRVGLPPDVRCVHGHFLPLKYRWVGRRRSFTGLGGQADAERAEAPVFVTWLREPVERLISHYLYWMKKTDPTGLPALHRRVIEEQWSLERFCLSGEMRNLYHQFLFGFPARRLAFVGLVERMEEDFAVFDRRYLGGDGCLVLPRANMVRAALDERHLQEGPLRRRIESFHRKDMDLYGYFVSRRPG